MVTVEAAFALFAFVVVLGLALAAIVASVDQIRCVDAAREAARLAARGDLDRGRTAAERIAPNGAQIAIHIDGEAVTVEVRAEPAGGLLPKLRLTGRAYALMEPGATSEAEP
jgi:hypothetical protein